MITIKNGTLEKIKDWTDQSIHVVTDFDRTITLGSSDSSWGILSKSNLVPKEYVSERQALFDYYRPIEVDETLDYETKNRLMSEWWNKHINLLIKYQLSEEVIVSAARNLRVMSFRKGAKELLSHLHQKGIPVMIISAGIGNFIKQYLIQNNCDFDNIYILSNFIQFENGIAVGVSDNVIHSCNKNEVSFPNDMKQLIAHRPNIILLGDSISDIRMVQEENRESALKIGFLEEKVDQNMAIFKDKFDIVCTDNTSFEELGKQLTLFRI